MKNVDKKTTNKTIIIIYYLILNHKNTEKVDLKHLKTK